MSGWLDSSKSATHGQRNLKNVQSSDPENSHPALSGRRRIKLPKKIPPASSLLSIIEDFRNLYAQISSMNCGRSILLWFEKLEFPEIAWKNIVIEYANRTVESLGTSPIFGANSGTCIDWNGRYLLGFSKWISKNFKPWDRKGDTSDEAGTC